jgi:hypothetical protein
VLAIRHDSASLIIMGKRRQDADNRKFFDQYEKVRVCRFRATGVVDPAKPYALIPVGERQKLIGTAHVRFPNGGGFSYFVCARCGKLAGVLYVVDDAPRCARCCGKLGIVYRTRMGFGRSERQRARDKALDRLIAKLETTEPLRFKPAPANWGGKCQFVYGSRRLTVSMRRKLIELRLSQIASQQASSLAKDDDMLRTYQATADARQLIDVAPIWRPAQPNSFNKR